MNMSANDLKSWLFDIRSVLEFVTEKLGELELSETGFSKATPLADIATACQTRSHLDSVARAGFASTTASLEVVPEVNLNTPQHAWAPQEDFAPVTVQEHQVQASPCMIGVSSVPRGIALDTAAPSIPLSAHNARRDTAHIIDELSYGGVAWVPLQKDDITKRTWSAKLTFLWLGLTKNNELRAIHLQIKQKLSSIANDAKALSGDTLQKQQHALAKQSHELRGVERVKSGDHRRSTSKHEHDATIALVNNTLSRLEHLLTCEWEASGRIYQHRFRTYVLMQMASCPLHQFILEYIADRDDALARQDPDEMRLEMTKAAVKAVAGMDILLASLFDRLNANDQLLFKLVLMVLNIMTLIGEYILANSETFQANVQIDRGKAK